MVYNKTKLVGNNYPDTVTITPSNMENLWEYDWIIAFGKGEKEQIGTASFAGEKLLGAVPLYVELMPQYRNRGLGTEIIRMMVNWAFLHKNVFEVVSKVEHENDKEYSVFCTRVPSIFSGAWNMILKINCCSF